MTWRSIKDDPHPTWNGTFLLCDARVGGGHMTAADWDWGPDDAYTRARAALSPGKGE